MPCNYPATGRKAPNGKVTFYGHLQRAAGTIPPLPPNYKDFPLPCGKCTGCKLEHSRQWAVRLMHEAHLHKRTSFLTLTYDENNLPHPAGASSQSLTAPAGVRLASETDVDSRAHAETHAHEDQSLATLSKADLQAFTKRLNQDVRRRFGEGVKYFACGEYGDQKGRPHYHLAVFGEDFSDDRQPWKRSKSGAQLWRSSRLTRLWPHGGAEIGDLTFESAAYIARYIMKKITGTKAVNHYNRVDRQGNMYQLQPEFSVMSRGGRTGRGIAAEWFLQYKTDVYPHDQVISRGRAAKPPRYYDKLLEALAPYEAEAIKLERERKAALQNPENNSPARLDAREAVMRAKLLQSKRSLE